jgi:hypothetical protein
MTEAPGHVAAQLFTAEAASAGWFGLKRAFSPVCAPKASLPVRFRRVWTVGYRSSRDGIDKVGRRSWRRTSRGRTSARHISCGRNSPRRIISHANLASASLPETDLTGLETLAGRCEPRNIERYGSAVAIS